MESGCADPVEPPACSCGRHLRNLCIELAAAYLSSSLLQAPWPIRNGGEEVVLYFFVFPYLAAAGADAWSLDRLIEKTKPNRRESSLTIGAAGR